MKKVLIIIMSAVMLLSYAPAVPSYASGQSAEAVSDTGGYIVVYDASETNRSIRKDLSGIGTVDAIESIASSKIALVSTDEPVPETEEALEKLENAEYYAPNMRYRILGTDTYRIDKDSPLYEYHLDNINAEKAWDLLEAKGHAMTTVGVIDTGVDPKHEDLKVNLTGLTEKKQYVGYGEGEEVMLSDDTDSHGTHVTGLIGATYGNDKGVSGAASGHNNDLVRVLTVCASADGYNLYTYDICKAIAYAVENGCRVISMSFGGPNRDPVLEQTIDHYYDEGIVFVAASGNETSDAYSSPSDYPTVISVNSSTRRNEPSYFSNYGRLRDVSAPGTAIMSTLPGDTYGLMYGTSMATPIASSVAALVLDADPSLTPEQVKNILCATAASEKGRGVFDINLAYGVVDAEAAVTAAFSAGSAGASEVKITENSVDDDRYTVVEAGDTISLSAIVKPAQCTQKVNWSSSDTSVLTVDSKGMVTGVREGTATVTASAGSLSDSISVKVKRSKTQNSKSVKIGGLPEDNIFSTEDEGGDLRLVTDDGKDVTADAGFTTSDASVIFVDSTGTYIIHGAGEAVITATYRGMSTSETVEVREAVGSIAFTKKTKYLRKGDTFTFEAEARGDGGSVYKPEITYSVSNSRGSVDKSTGLFKAKKPGYCFVIASTENETSEYAKVYILKSSYKGSDYKLKARVKGRKAKLTWKKIPSAVKYEVYRKTGSGWKKIGTSSKASFTDKHYRSGAKYRVRAKYKYNGKSGRYGYSNVAAGR